MQTGRQQPLEIATKVLKPKTMEVVRRSPSFHLQAWKILDRWAYNSPEKLKALEAEGQIVLFDRVLTQQATENEILTSLPGLEQRRNGLMEHEILAMNEINTEL